jgi:NAD(P)-dependent dehydrogenase (short-subunit alcohol dehydrogenase family)
MGLLDGKSVVVCGAAQGIPQAVAQLATREGGKVLALDINAEGLEETARLILKEGGRPLTTVCDVTDRSQVDEAVALAAKEHGTVDVLVNGAMTIKIGPFEEHTAEDLQRVLNVNLFGPFHFMQACFPHMREHGGRIINFASGSGTRGSADHGSYAASKEGLRGLSKAAAKAWIQYGITVNCVMPHAATPGMQEVALARGPEGLENVRKLHPMQRHGDAMTDIAPVVVFLASDGAGYINGRSIFVDGGFSGFW